MTDKLSYSIDEAIEALGTGRASLYKIISRGELATYTIGKRRHISRAAMEEFIARREAAASPFAKTPRTGGRRSPGWNRGQ